MAETCYLAGKRLLGSVCGWDLVSVIVVSSRQ